MGAEVIILVNPYTYNFLKGLTHSALKYITYCVLMKLFNDFTLDPNPFHWQHHPLVLRILQDLPRSLQKRRIIADCRETKRKFLFGTEMEDGERERIILGRMVSYLALGGA